MQKRFDPDRLFVAHGFYPDGNDDSKSICRGSENELDAVGIHQEHGSMGEKALFRANAGGATMWFAKEGVTYQFTRRIDRSGAVSVSGLRRKYYRKLIANAQTAY
ncbi:MAG: hypothetical protein NT028_10950 [candidate division Zixibacteria bacterium]|nr:hypothetical protein [candidate division Zixibacteria bacterium]